MSLSLRISEKVLVQLPYWDAEADGEAIDHGDLVRPAKIQQKNMCSGCDSRSSSSARFNTLAFDGAAFPGTLPPVSPASFLGKGGGRQ